MQFLIKLLMPLLGSETLWVRIGAKAQLASKKWRIFYYLVLNTLRVVLIFHLSRKPLSIQLILSLTIPPAILSPCIVDNLTCSSTADLTNSHRRLASLLFDTTTTFLSARRWVYLQSLSIFALSNIEQVVSLLEFDGDTDRGWSVRPLGWGLSLSSCWRQAQRS